MFIENLFASIIDIDDTNKPMIMTNGLYCFGGHPTCLSVIIWQKVVLIKYSIIILYYIHNDGDNYFMTVLP